MYFVVEMATRKNELEKERETVEIMIRMYCRAHHAGVEGLCGDCRELAEYASARLDKCMFGDDKPTCANCPVHCYKPSMREQVKKVMRYSGPRMMLRHPVLAVRHVIRGRKKFDTKNVEKEG